MTEAGFARQKRCTREHARRAATKKYEDARTDCILFHEKNRMKQFPQPRITFVGHNTRRMHLCIEPRQKIVVRTIISVKRNPDQWQ